MDATAPSLTPQAIALMNAMAAATFKDAGTTPGTQLHGPGGLLATPGMNKQVINAMILPRGLAGRLPVRPSVDTNEIVPILTGLTASSGSEPTAACADWPTVGEFKVCRQTFPFGKQGRMSKVLDIANAGQIVNRGEFRDNVLFGRPDGDLPGAGPVDWGGIFRSEAEKKLGELYAGYMRDYARYTYTGNPQTTAGSQGWQQYRGLDLQINTGKRDAITGALCPAADSIVFDFNGAVVNTAGTNHYAYMANIITNLERLATQLSIDVKWALVMSYGAFWTLSNIWPCVYATAGCGTSGLVHSGSIEEATAMRDRMRKGNYLLIEGKEYEVIIDDTLAESVPASGNYQSDVYLVPLTGNGQPLTYWEYFNFNEEAISAASKMAPAGYFTTDQNGRFLLVRQSPTHTCVQIEVIERPRLVLLTPFLAARFTNVRYQLTVHERQSFTTDPYFVNGGGTNSPLPYFYPNATGG